MFLNKTQLRRLVMFLTSKNNSNYHKTPTFFHYPKKWTENEIKFNELEAK